MNKNIRVIFGRFQIAILQYSKACDDVENYRPPTHANFYAIANVFYYAKIKE